MVDVVRSVGSARLFGCTGTDLRRLLVAGISAVALLALSTGLASAQTAIWTGATSNDWTVGSNWVTGLVPTTGQPISIDAISPNATVLGVGGPVNVSLGVTTIGASSRGNLTIQNGSTLTSVASSRIGSLAGGIGVVTVTGAGSQWSINAGTFYVGFQGTGTLNIQNGAKVVAGLGTTLGSGGPSSGTLNINGGGYAADTIPAGRRRRGPSQFRRRRFAGQDQ